MSVAIKIENISKQYRLGLVGTGTLSHDLRRWWHLVRGKEDPYLKIGEVNDRSTKGTSEYVWALKDINFEVQQGEVLGIIGKNGAGKSTLLKILSKVTAPTTGSISYQGRIASLLEVGTGFNPELTGRENLYLNGAILGMRKLEIDRKFDEIVDFSGCERYIDTPTKRYSSGMTVRLGFAVAAFLEPEILVVDEVLAVGDAEFQKKAIGKMQDVSRKDGRTVLFVSHNMETISKLCRNTILLSNGTIELNGNTPEVISKYLNANESENKLIFENSAKSGAKPLIINKVLIYDKENNELFSNCSELIIEIDYSVFKIEKNTRIVLSIINSSGIEIFSVSDYYVEKPYKETGSYKAIIKIPPRILSKGTHFVRLRVDIPRDRVITEPYDYISFTINNIVFEQIGDRALNEPTGIIHLPVDWNIKEI